MVDKHNVNAGAYGGTYKVSKVLFGLADIFSDSEVGLMAF